jgi:hypothetical protein
MGASSTGLRRSDLLLGFIFVSLPFEFFLKRGPHKVGDANKFMPRCPLNFEEHGVRYAGLDRSAVGSRKYFSAPALSKGVCLRFSGHSRYDPSTPLVSSCHSRANQSQNSFIMKSLVSFARSSQARAFAQQYSGFNTPAFFSSL